MNSDFRDLLRVLNEEKVRYLVAIAKTTAGRLQDLADIEELQRALPPED